jgi:hypothetical protein
MLIARSLHLSVSAPLRHSGFFPQEGYLNHRGRKERR